MAAQILLVLCTFPDAGLAKRVARQLIENKLAACANITAPVESVYRWEGKIEEAAEVMVIFKTTSERFEQLQSKLRALHPYNVPEIIAWPLRQGLPEYLNWVSESCS